MRTEKEKMLAGELYDPLDSELVQARDRARDLCQDLNASRERDQDARRRILKELFGQGGESVWMQPPFFCDYGSNILLGESGVNTPVEMIHYGVTKRAQLALARGLAETTAGTNVTVKPKSLSL